MLLPVIQWSRDAKHMDKHVMILVGQGIEAFGLLIMTGDLSWMGKGNSIFCTGVGCMAMGISMCILTAVIIPEMYEAITNLADGHKYCKKDIAVYVSNMNMIVTAICEGLGFFAGCFFGIGMSYNIAFYGSSALTVAIICAQIAVYYIPCGSKPAAAEKKNDGEGETENLLNKKETASKEVKS